MSNGMIFIESGVSAFTSEPFITLAWGDERGQLTVAEARAHAFALLEACEAATSDAFLFHFARERVGMEVERAAVLLADFRAYRGEAPPATEIPKSEE